MLIRVRTPSTVVALAAIVPLALGTGCDAGPSAQPANDGRPAAEAIDGKAMAGESVAGESMAENAVGLGAAAHGVAAAASAGLRATPVATSLLGDPLYPLAMDSATERRRLAQLDAAEAAYEARPHDPVALIWLGRRLAYLGHYREAIAVFTEGIEAHPEDPRFYRHRGHRFITVRQLDRATDDLELAARLISGREDVVEPDGMPNEAGIPRSTLHTNIWYHLGLARYLEHDFEGAVHAFRRGYEISPNDDMRVAMADWLWLALRRLGRDEEAADLLTGISSGMEILENDAYLHRLLVYKGDLPSDSLLGGSLSGADPLTIATHGYGIGAWRLIRGDPIRAKDAFERVLDTGYWPAFAVIAAEAELRRLADMRTDREEPSSRPLKPAPPGTVDSM